MGKRKQQKPPHRTGPDPAAGRPFEPRAPRARSDSGDAFLPDPQEGAPARTGDDLAETLAEGFVESATNGGNVEDEVRDQVVPEEIGGPFIESDERREFASGVDESNPEDAEVEPRPRAVAGLVQPGEELEFATDNDNDDDDSRSRR